jgi:hypothetical protein
MISLDACETLIKKTNKEVTREQVKQIRDFLYALATVEYEAFKKMNDEQKRDHLHKGVDR